MKRFKVLNNRKNAIIYVTLHDPPYENENILYKTGWKSKDCKIEEISVNAETTELQTEVSIIDNSLEEN
tara:strand:- start:181 stop:387 length:207 start_codon:yes stop_codon:yes gene_type:complete